MSNRRIQLLFTVVQVTGLTSLWFTRLVPWHRGETWAIAFILLFPGDLLGYAVVEEALWMSKIHPVAFDVLGDVAGVVINSILWFLAWYVATLRSRTRASEGTGAS